MFSNALTIWLFPDHHPHTDRPVPQSRSPQICEEYVACHVSAQQACSIKLGDQFGDPLVESRASLATGLVCNGTSELHLIGSGGPGNGTIDALSYPVAGCDLRELGA